MTTPSFTAPQQPASQQSSLYALVPCAGVGSRAGAAGPKQYAYLAGQSLVAHTLAALAQVVRLKAVLVVLSPDDRSFEQHAPQHSLHDSLKYTGWVCRRGGASRALTVTQGLDELHQRGAQPQDWVLVHDAARCLVHPAAINTLIDACLTDPVGGLLALPVADTLKTDHQGRVGATVSRMNLWQAQTPQMFRLQLLQDALRHALTQASVSVTDEASAIEAMGYAPKLVPSSMENFKITYPADFDLAETLLSARALKKHPLEIPINRKPINNRKPT
jgi:2-C-methyl-D-erythritol 4-phosphate cytidylyltransferase